MKTLKEYILEKLVIKKGKSNKSNKIKVSDIQELRKLIIERSNTSHDLDLTDIDVSEVELFNKTFAFLSQITSVDITGWDVSNAIDMKYMFQGCMNLKEIIGLDDLDVSNIESFEGTFSGCHALENLEDISDWDISKSQSTYSMFRKCDMIKNINFVRDWDITNIKKHEFYVWRM